MNNQLPSISSFTSSEITEAQFKVALTQLRAYLAEAIGANGENMNTLPASTGSGVKPVYTNANKQLVASTSTVGSGTNPVFLNAGTITRSTANVGSSSKPVYMNAGALTECSDSIAGTVKTNNGPYAVGTYCFVSLTYGNLAAGASVTVDGFSSSGAKMVFDALGVSRRYSQNSRIYPDLTGKGNLLTATSSLSGTWRFVGKFTIKNDHAYAQTMEISGLAQRIA